jgi:4'-phosphopantetheinyl transferase
MPPCEVLVWWAPLSALRPIDLSLLDDTEQERLRSFSDPDAGRRFALGAVLLRLAVSSLTDARPRTVRVDRSGNGRPVVAGGPHVSVSHSHDVVAVACTAAAPVGLDVEMIQGESEDLRIAVSPRDVLAATAHRELVTWTMKEAYLKAVGTGLRTEPNAVALSGDETRADVTSAPDGLPVPASVSGVSVKQGYLGAVCVLGHDDLLVVIRDGTKLLDVS